MADNSGEACVGVRLCGEEVQGHYCLTQFYGMDFTTDKLRSLVRKWQTLIEAFVDVKTADGYVMRLFCIGFTKKRQNQLKKTCYANSSQVKPNRDSLPALTTAHEPKSGRSRRTTEFGIASCERCFSSLSESIEATACGVCRS